MTIIGQPCWTPDPGHKDSRQTGTVAIPGPTSAPLLEGDVTAAGSHSGAVAKFAPTEAVCFSSQVAEHSKSRLNDRGSPLGCWSPQSESRWHVEARCWWKATMVSEAQEALAQSLLV